MEENMVVDMEVLEENMVQVIMVKDLLNLDMAEAMEVDMDMVEDTV